MPGEFIDISYLTNLAGMVIALVILVQFIKWICPGKIADALIRPIAFVLAVLMVGVMIWTQGYLDVSGRELAGVLLAWLINTIIVTLSAMGAYEAFADPRATKVKPDDYRAILLNKSRWHPR